MIQDRSAFASHVILVALAFAGCTPPVHERLNTPPQGPTDRPSRMQANYTYSTDNALLADMSMNDSHFLNRQAVLSGTGEARLARYCELLAESGGTINYTSSESDDALMGKRLDTARAFVAAQRGDAKGQPILIESGLASGRGMEAQWAGVFRNLGMGGWGARKDPPTRLGTGDSGGGGGGAGGGSGGGGGGSGAARSSRTSTSTTR